MPVESKLHPDETFMRIPDHINILGYNYQVKICNDFKKDVKPHLKAGDDADSFSGYFSTDVNTIWIDDFTTEQNKESIFIHEVLEAINAHLALNIKHDTIERLEAALYQIIKENNLR
jgi:hypothetical protein